MKPLRLVERAIVRFGWAQPTIKAIADTIRDYPECFAMRRTAKGGSSWVTHRSLQFSVLRVESNYDWLPTYSIVQRSGRVSHKLSWWGRALLSVAWPEHLEPDDEPGYPISLMLIGRD